MKNTVYIFILFLISCSGFAKKQTINSKIELPKKNVYIHLDKLSIVGDFNGDKISDTIFQNNISRLTKTQIDSIPKTGWDSVIQFFNKVESDIILTSSDKKIDTLHLGIGKGLYCLINVGDINNDGKDEIALSIDYCDLSNLNSCKIFTFRKNKLTQLYSFGILESAFDINNNTKTIFNEIPGYLENKDGIWEYSDYDKQEWVDDNNLKKYNLNAIHCFSLKIF